MSSWSAYYTGSIEAMINQDESTSIRRSKVAFKRKYHFLITAYVPVIGLGESISKHFSMDQPPSRCPRWNMERDGTVSAGLKINFAKVQLPSVLSFVKMKLKSPNFGFCDFRLYG